LIFDERHPLFRTYRIAKRIVIAIVGGSVLAMGLIMMVTPGPGIPAILAGLGILAIEFAWARSWLKKAKARAEAVARNLNARRAARNGGPPAA
jgi:tellurite resistance protein TerC